MTSLSVRQGKLNSAVHRQILPALRLLECTHLQRRLPGAIVDRHLVTDIALLLARTGSGTAAAFLPIAPRVTATGAANETVTATATATAIGAANTNATATANVTATATAIGATSANVNATATTTPTTLWSVEAQGGAPEAQIEHLEGAGQRQGACRPTADTGGGAAHRGGSRAPFFV